MCKASRDIMMKLQPDALINAAAFKVQGHDEKSDLDPDDAMAMVMTDIDEMKKKHPHHVLMVLSGWATSLLCNPPHRLRL
jgi:hypothetical protein